MLIILQFFTKMNSKMEKNKKILIKINNKISSNTIIIKFYKTRITKMIKFMKKIQKSFE